MSLTLPDEAPDRAFTPGASSTGPKPCDHCLDGDPHLCTGVRCYRCPCPCGTRRHGLSAAAPEGPEHGAPSTLKAPRR